MALLLRIALAELIRQAVDERDVDRDSLAVPGVGAGDFRLVVHVCKSVLECISLCGKPPLVEGVEGGLYLVEAFTVFVFALCKSNH